MDKEDIKRLSEFVKIWQQGVTKEEFTKSFKAVLTQIASLEKQLVERNDRAVREMKSTINALSEEVKTLGKKEIATMLSNTEDRMGQMFDQQRASINYLYDKARGLKDGNPGKDGRTPTTEEIIALIKPLIPEPVKPEKITLADIEGLDEYIRDRIPKKLGGGHTDIGVQYTLGRIVKTETPSGTINGSNTEFTTTQPIHAVLSYMLNGEVIGSTNYSVANNKITWTVAPPAAYSGKDHEIVYV